jgi:ubiquinone/menaquinone biosynthesis C-methylase UbiE
LIDAIVVHALQPNNHEMLRRLAQVLGITASSEVLLIADEADSSGETLESELKCSVTHYGGDLRRLPFEDRHFDTVIVALPVATQFHAVARELHRVLKPNGTLGMVAFSLYRDQMPDNQALIDRVLPLLARSRPAAAYRAVLAECGFTAFVSQDRRREVRQTALDNYRQHMLSDNSSEQPADAAAQALELLAGGGVGVTLITAEKAA